MAKFCAHYSRLEIEQIQPDKSVALISIRNPGSDRPVIRIGAWHAVLELAFHDLDSSTRRSQAWWNQWVALGYIPPSAPIAREIADFVRRHWERSIVVHCEMGQSRSAAICEILTELGWIYRPTHPEARRLANGHLVELLGRELTPT